MTCCEKCEAPIRNGFGEKVGEQCINPNCPCHSKDEELERVLQEFDKKFGASIDVDDWNSPYMWETVKSFITQVYKEAYKAGQNGAYLPLEESMAYKKGREEERQRIRKEIEKMLRFGPNNNALSRDDVFTYLESWRYCLNQVKKII